MSCKAETDQLGEPGGGALNGTGIKCFVTGGNDDEWDVLNVMKREDTRSFFACENEMVQVDDDHTMISIGISTPTPWKTPRETLRRGTGQNDRRDGGEDP
jgi:Icc-related predicted phosphoesterase